MGGDPRFHTTRWSVVLAAKTPSDPSSVEALTSLCREYWYPVYTFIRRLGHRADEAADLTQGYFADLLAKNTLRAAEPSRGRFRSFVIATVKQHLSHERDRSRAIKRGGAHEIVPLDPEAAEQRFVADRAAERSPEQAFEYSWALAVLARARKSLQEEFGRQGKAGQYAVLGSYLTGDAGPSYRSAAERLGTTEAAIKMGVRRMRQRFGALVREEIAGTVDESADVDAEARHLLAVLGGW